MLQELALGELGVCWILWLLALLVHGKRSAGKEPTRRSASVLWSILLNLFGLGCILAYVRPAGFEKPFAALVFSMVLAALSALLAISAAMHLSGRRQFEIALREGRESVVSGPYRWLRYPMYGSMLGMAVATAVGYSWWPLIVVGMPILLVGIELGVSAEDRVLEDRFQDVFIEYSSQVKAYIPFLR